MFFCISYLLNDIYFFIINLINDSILNNILSPLTFIFYNRKIYYKTFLELNTMKFISKFRNLYHSSRQNLTLMSNTLKTPNSYNDDILEKINKNDFSSKTKYFIWVDTKNFKTNIFKGNIHYWTLENSFLYLAPLL